MKQKPSQTKKRRKPRARKKKALPIWIYLLILAIGAVVIWFIATQGDKKPAPEPTPQNSSEPVDNQKYIDLIVKKLGVPEGSVSLGSDDQMLVLGIPIDRTRMDLTFANMIIKGELERQGIKMLSGKAVDKQQILTFQGPGQQYRIELYYSSDPYAANTSEKLLAIVVDDFGSTDGELLKDFLKLPTAVTFAIFPGMKNSVYTMEQADQQGRQTLIHVPMEPMDYPLVNPGEDPILIQMKEGQVDRILHKHLNAMPLCMGINNHMGSLATTDPDIMGSVMKVLAKKGKLFLDSRTSNVSIAYQAAQKAHIPAYRNDLFLDSPDISQPNMARKIEQIKTLSVSRNNIIAITHCHSREKLDYLLSFIEQIQAEGFTLVPLTRVGKYDVPKIL